MIFFKITFSIDDINALVNGDAEFNTWLSGLASTDLDKYTCIARIPQDFSLWGIEVGMFNINANGLKLFNEWSNNFNFADYFNFDFSASFTAGGFDLTSIATLDPANLEIFVAGFNEALQPYFSAFEIFNSMGIFNFEFPEIDVTNIANFDFNIFAE